MFFFHLCLFNSSFLPTDSTNPNFHFDFDVLLHTRLFCFVINAADKICQYVNMLRTKHMLFANGRSCRTFSFKVNQNKKTVQIKGLFFHVRKFLSHIPVTCKSLSIFKQIHERLIFILMTHSLLSVLNFFLKCKFSLVTTVLSKRVISIKNHKGYYCLANRLCFINHGTEIKVTN